MLLQLANPFEAICPFCEVVYLATLARAQVHNFIH